jgi:3-isopropylmalate dehydratase small subunit
VYDPNLGLKMQGMKGDEMAKVQSECQAMLDKLNGDILNARNNVGCGSSSRTLTNVRSNSALKKKN